MLIFWIAVGFTIGCMTGWSIRHALVTIRLRMILDAMTIEDAMTVTQLLDEAVEAIDRKG